jgi:diguanylate cyclase (GGDEF)-like protein
VTGTLFSTATTAGIAAGVAVGASLLTIGLVLLAIRHLNRRRQTPEEQVGALVRELDLRIRQLGDDLSEELARTKEDSLRSRFLGELAWSIELKEVMSRTLDAAAALPGVDAALVTVLDTTGERVTQAMGLSEEERSQLAVERPPSSSRIQSMTIAYAPGGPFYERDDTRPVSTSLAVPIEVRGQTMGILSVFSRKEFHVFDEESLGQLGELASRAGPAIHNARRFQETRRLAELDARTGLHNARYFDETLVREVARARRYQRRLALVLFDLDDFKQINDRQGHLVGDAALAGVAERVREVLRSADIACRYGGDEFGIILPEATSEDARQFYARLQTQITARPIEPVGTVSLSCGIAELEAQEDATTFFKRADDALYRAKESGKGKMTLAASGVRPISDDVLRSAISDIEPGAAGS